MSDTRHLTRLSRIALVVAAIDLATKAVAKAVLVNEPAAFTRGLQLAVVHNDAGAFGWSAGVYTWQLNLALTLAAIVFMIPVTRDLARVDRTAPLALGLIVGGALGNLVSLLTSPAGVLDFVAINFDGWGIVLNAADVAAYAGLAMILRTGVIIATAIVRDRRAPAVESPVAIRELFAERRAIASSSPRARRFRRLDPSREIPVGDWSHIEGTPALVADAPPPADVEPVVLPLDVARRTRALPADMARPLSHTERPQAPREAR